MSPAPAHQITGNVSAAHPPTIIVVHQKEKRRKCTVEPLRGRPDFEFRTYPLEEAPLPENYVRLGLGGPILSVDDASHGLLVLDATWKLADRMAWKYESVPLRTLPPVETAYPRTSKIYSDPSSGLATIEAIYAAFRVLGWNTEGLLDRYHWADDFLRRNGWAAEQKHRETSP